MAAPTIEPDRIDRQLTIVKHALIDLRDIAPDWTNLNIGIKMGWEQEWRDYMHRFEKLHQTYRVGGMSEDQQVRFLRLQHELEESAALVESLGLQRPPVLSST